MVVVTDQSWQLRGSARILKTPERPAQLALLRATEAEWREIVEVRRGRHASSFERHSSSRQLAFCH